MGRTKTQLRKIENPTYRHITFAKRKCGILKKAYELSILCDIELALLLFSPAGKLFLFEGKNRLEEIVQLFIDLPEQQRGRLKDKQELLNEIIFCNSELEEIEREMSYFLRSPSYIQTVSEAEQHEMILKYTLKNVQFRKQVLERYESFTTSEEPYYPMTVDQPIIFPNSINSNPNPSINMTPDQINADPHTILNVSGRSGFQPFSNEAQASPETFQLSTTLLDGYQFPSQNVLNNEYMPLQPHQFEQFDNTNLPSTSTMYISKLGNAKTAAAGQSQEGYQGCYGGAYSIS